MIKLPKDKNIQRRINWCSLRIEGARAAINNSPFLLESEKVRINQLLGKARIRALKRLLADPTMINTLAN